MSKMTEEEFLDLVATNLGARLSIIVEKRSSPYLGKEYRRSDHRRLLKSLREIRDRTYNQLSQLNVLRRIP